MTSSVGRVRIALRVSEVAVTTGATSKTVRGWIARGLLKASRPSPRMFLIRPEHLQEFLERTAVQVHTPSARRGTKSGRIPTPRRSA